MENSNPLKHIHLTASLVETHPLFFLMNSTCTIWKNASLTQHWSSTFCISLGFSQTPFPLRTHKYCCCKHPCHTGHARKVCWRLKPQKNSLWGSLNACWVQTVVTTVPTKWIFTPERTRELGIPARWYPWWHRGPSRATHLWSHSGLALVSANVCTLPHSPSLMHKQGRHSPLLPAIHPNTHLSFPTLLTATQSQDASW